jgi:tetratricopeptide (TPR) repeat protein
MTSPRLCLLLALMFGVPCLLFGEGAPSEKKPQAAAMQEDVEIMRRILNRALDLPRHAPQAVPTTNANNVYPTWGTNPIITGQNVEPIHHWDTWNNTGINQPQLIWNNSNIGWVSTLRYPPAEGVYLKGHGVVFTLTLPPQKDLKPSAPAPSEKALTEWERERKELRGEKVDGAGAEKKAKEPTIADILIKLLAENGKHFTQLAPDETVTIVVTFRQTEGGAGAVDPILINHFYPQDSYLRPNQLNLYQLQVDQPANKNSTKEIKTGEGAPASSGEVTTKGPSAKAKDSLLLGDLHYKQGKFAEAADAYTAALKELQDLKESDTYAEACRKLAQALLAEDKPEEAKAHLEQWIKYKKVETAPAKKDAPAAQAPTKLILSAPKKLLDQVGSGKMSLEEFKKQVTVEYDQAVSPSK